MRLSFCVILALLLAGPSLAEGPAGLPPGLVKPPVTHAEVAQKLEAALGALGDIEIRSSQAKTVSDIQAVLAWAAEKVKNDLKSQASDLINERDVCESKLRDINGANAK